jgi:hypothetical protein
VNIQHKKNRITIIVIFAMSIIPFGIAWYFASNPTLVKMGTNNGELITPPVTTEHSEFAGNDDFSAENLKELSGHWVLINPVPNRDCQEICQEALYKTRQIILMMAKDIPRVRRIAALLNTSGESALTGEWLADAQLIKIRAMGKLPGKLLDITGRPIADGCLLIMDPLGNLMMKYPPGYDPYKVKNDLSKLLRISQIG